MSQLILICFIVKNALGQTNEKKTSLGLGGGVDLINNLDEAISPLSYQGFGYPTGINVQAINEKRINRFEANFILPLLTNNHPLTSKTKTQLFAQIGWKIWIRSLMDNSQ